MDLLDKLGFSRTAKGFHVLGKTFPTREAALQFATEAAAARSLRAGRELSDSEVKTGVNHKEDRDRIAQNRDERWQPIMPATEAEAVEKNPYRRVDAEILGGKKQSKRARYEELAKAWDKRHGIAEQTEAAANDPRRQSAIQYAEQNLERVLWDAQAPRSAVTKAQQLLAQAKSGCLDHFKSMADEQATAAEEAFNARENEARVAANRRKHEMDALRPAYFESPIPPDAKVGLYTSYNGEKSYVVTRKGEDGMTRELNRWPIESAPLEIVNFVEKQNNESV